MPSEARNSEIYRMVSETHRLHGPLNEAWCGLFLRLLGSMGVVVADLDCANLRHLFMTSRARGAAYPSNEARTIRGRLRQAGYHPLTGMRRWGAGGRSEDGGVRLTRRAANLCQLSAHIPVVAVVSGAAEFDEMAEIAADASLNTPLVWPLPGMTVLEGRSRRFMEKLGIGPEQLFEGVERLLREALPTEVAKRLGGRLGAAHAHAEIQLAALQHRLGSDQARRTKIYTLGKRILHQFDRAQDRANSAFREREASLRRKLERLCSRGAPAGRLQEQQFTLFQMLVAFSPALLPWIVERLTPLATEHQVLFTD